MANGTATQAIIDPRFPSGDPGLFVLQPYSQYEEVFGSEGSSFENVLHDPGYTFRSLVTSEGIGGDYGIIREVTREEAFQILTTDIRTQGGSSTAYRILEIDPATKTEPLYLAKYRLGYTSETGAKEGYAIVYPSISGGYIGAQLPDRKKNFLDKIAPYVPLAAIGAGFGIGAIFGTGGAAGAGSVAVGAEAGGEAAALAPVTAAPGVSLAEGGYLLEAPTTFGLIEGGAETALATEAVGGGAVVAGGSGLSTLGYAGLGAAASTLFRTAVDTGTEVLKEIVGDGVTKEVQSFFGGSGGGGGAYPTGGTSGPSFFESLKASGAALPIILILITLLGAFALTKKKRRK